MDAGGISTVITSILFVLIAVAYGHKLFTEGAFTSGAPADLSFLSLLVLYFPNTLFAYGFIADIMNGKYHYSVASITALGGMFTNKVLGGYVVDTLMYILSFLGAQFSKLSTGAQAAVATAAALGSAAVAGPTAAAIAANPFTSASVPAAAAAVANPFTSAAVPAAAAAVAATPAVSAAVNPFEESTNDSEDGVPSTNPFRGGATDLCSLPGFEWLENKVAPQGIVMSMTVLWYLMIELWDTGAGPQSMALGITSAITFGLQWFVLHRSNCLTSYKYGTYSAIIALIMGITFAGTSYGIQKQLAKYRGSSNVPPVPSGTPGTFICPPGTSASIDGQSCQSILGPGGIAPSAVGSSKSESIINVGGSNEKTQAVDDNDQFVCEAYKDGELITSTILE
jgi:hypothetical protein